MSLNEKKFTVGEVAKKLNVSVRTIQYYDQIGLISPSEFTEGGRRLYSIKDYISLNQIISLKEFGFSLKAIKEQMMSAETVIEMDIYLKRQEELIEEEIKRNQVKFKLLSMFRNEMNKVGKIDWEMFVEIINMLRNQDEHYWIVKYLDKTLYEKIKNEYQQNKGKEYIRRMTKICEKLIELQDRNIAPNSKEAIILAEKWWNEILYFTKGDKKMIHQLTELTKKSKDEKQTEFLKKFRKIENYISSALEFYFKENNIKFEEEKND